MHLRYLLFASILSAACGEAGQADPQDLTACTPEGAPEAPIRKLTQTEYTNTVRDLTGVSLDGRRLVEDAAVMGFDNAAQEVSVSQLAADGYLRQAEDLTEELDESSLLKCDPGSGAAGEKRCAERLIDTFGRRVFRRPLDLVEGQIFLDLFHEVSDSDGYDIAIEAVVQALLQSPQFLYRPEWGHDSVDGELVQLTDYEIASRMSYLLWESTPDEMLLAEAEAGTLSSPRQLRRQTKRMLADDRAREAVAHFVEQWVGTTTLEASSKNAEDYPEWSTELAADMREETRRFAVDVVFDGDGTVQSFFDADYTFVNGAIAELYDVPGPDDPTSWQRIELTDGRRSGLLTHPSVMSQSAHAQQTSVVRRGVLVRERLLCQELIEPPADLDISLPPLDESLSTRERFSRHMLDPQCASCHRLTDPVGLGLEHFDPIGRWRDTEGDGVPVDASGLLVNTGETDGPFYGAAELGSRLATSEPVMQCFVLNWFRVAHGRDPGDADECALENLELSLADSGNDVQTLLHALVQSRSFLWRDRVQP